MSKEELLELYREFGDNAQKALDFVLKNSHSTDEHGTGTAPDTQSEPGPVSFDVIPDSVYIIMKNGEYFLFDRSKNYDKTEVKYIGIVHDGHTFAVALKDLGEYALFKEGVTCPKEHPFYRRYECDALLDWEYVERTRHIQELGTDIPLPDGEYLPSLPMLVVMFHYRGELNEALEHVGGEPFDMDNFYWSATEYNTYNAWYVNFYSGNVISNLKNITNYVVRPVSAFNL